MVRYLIQECIIDHHNNNDINNNVLKSRWVSFPTRVTNCTTGESRNGCQDFYLLKRLLIDREVLPFIQGVPVGRVYHGPDPTRRDRLEGSTEKGRWSGPVRSIDRWKNRGIRDLGSYRVSGLVDLPPVWVRTGQ